jgi:pyridoxamine--pyruvate transaminase
MGPTAHPIYSVVAISALGGALNALGRKTDTGAGVEAVLAAIGKKI